MENIRQNSNHEDSDNEAFPHHLFVFRLVVYFNVEMLDLRDHRGFNLSHLRFYLGLRLSTVHIANLMSVLAIGASIPKPRSMFPWNLPRSAGQYAMLMTRSRLQSLLQYQDHLFQVLTEMMKSLKLLYGQLKELQLQFRRLRLKIKVPQRESLRVIGLKGINPQLTSL